MLEQAADEGLPTEGAKRYFGLFYNALQDPGIRPYLGLPDSASVEALPVDPIEEKNIGNLDRVLRWLFGAEGRRRIITESRDISKLGTVLGNSVATRTLEERGDLESALRIAGGDKQSLETSLREARLELLSANGQAFQYVGDPQITEQVLGIKAVVDRLLSTLAGKERE